MNIVSDKNSLRYSVYVVILNVHIIPIPLGGLQKINNRSNTLKQPSPPSCYHFPAEPWNPYVWNVSLILARHEKREERPEAAVMSFFAAHSNRKQLLHAWKEVAMPATAWHFKWLGAHPVEDEYMARNLRVENMVVITISPPWVKLEALDKEKHSLFHKKIGDSFLYVHREQVIHYCSSYYATGTLLFS